MSNWSPALGHASANTSTPRSSSESAGDASSDIIPNPTGEWAKLLLAEWPPTLALDSGICSPLTKDSVPRGNVPPPTSDDPLPLAPVDSHLKMLRNALATGSRVRALDQICEMITYTVCLRRKVHVIVDKRGTCKMDGLTHWGNMTCATGALIEEVQIFLFMDAHRRKAYREGKPLGDVDPPLEPEQGMAQSQM
ncbi:hypothetical protein DXG03_005783, partial [Asterophora parasitica]